jgi:hypothetical protein
MREQSSLLYLAESYMFNFPDDLKLLWYIKAPLKMRISYLIIAAMAVPTGLLFQVLIHLLNFFTVKFKTRRKDGVFWNDNPQ